jgi:hypothetical protein
VITPHAPFKQARRDEMAIIQNIFVRVIIMPVIFAVLAAGLESVAALVKGKCRGQYKYRLWIRQQQSDKSTVLVPLLGQSLQSARTLSDVVAIEPMVSFDLADFGPLAVDLIVGAFAVDIASLSGAPANPVLIGYILTGHLLLLIVIVALLMLSHQASPEELSDKRNSAAAAILLGLLAMMLAFITL